MRSRIVLCLMLSRFLLLSSPPPLFCSVLCSLFSVLCSLFSVLCSLFSVLCSLFSVLCSLFSVLCPLSSVLCPLSSVLCPLSSVLCPLSSVLCPLSSVLCPLSSVLCPLSSVLCPLSSVLCPLSSVLCPLLLSSVLCCAVLCCAVLRCAALCCAVLCCWTFCFASCSRCSNTKRLQFTYVWSSKIFTTSTDIYLPTKKVAPSNVETVFCTLTRRLRLKCVYPCPPFVVRFPVSNKVRQPPDSEIHVRDRGGAHWESNNVIQGPRDASLVKLSPIQRGPKQLNICCLGNNKLHKLRIHIPSSRRGPTRWYRTDLFATSR